MRPQHITAENAGAARSAAAGAANFNEAAAYHCGKRVRPLADPLLEVRTSMRPQHITAENVVVALGSDRDVATSMRPQHITAENDAIAPRRGERASTSMRPQHITAENSTARPHGPAIRPLQ